MTQKALYDKEYHLKHQEKKKQFASAWYYNNLEKAKETRRKWREGHPEEMKAYQRKYYLLNKDKVKQKAKKWYEAQTPERKREIHRRVYRKNPSKYIFYSKKRNRLKRCSGGTHSFEEWVALKVKYDLTCVGCNKKEPEISLTEDHIIPLTKGGTDSIDNIQPLCSRCNSIKGNKLNYNFNCWELSPVKPMVELVAVFSS